MSERKQKSKITGIQLYPATVMRLKMLGATGKSKGKRISYDVVVNELIDFYEGRNRRVSKLGEKMLADTESGEVWLENMG